MKTDYKKDMFEAFKLICQMEIPDNVKSRMLTTLYTMEPNHWRVTGISVEALKVFHDNGYKNRPKIGINRSHIVDRQDSNQELLQQFAFGGFENHEQWWEYFWGNDATCLMTSSENMKKTEASEIIYFDNPGFSLFKSKGFGWKHGKEEEELLEQLYKNAAVLN